MQFVEYNTLSFTSLIAEAFARGKEITLAYANTATDFGLFFVHKTGLGGSDYSDKKDKRGDYDFFAFCKAI
jgi:hypothetical protein